MQLLRCHIQTPPCHVQVCQPAAQAAAPSDGARMPHCDEELSAGWGLCEGRAADGSFLLQDLEATPTAKVGPWGLRGERGLGTSPPLSAFLCPADNRVETGTIAGIASALAMALVGAVSSYISYQQKKFCFSIQRKEPRVGVGGLPGGGLQSGTWCVGTALQVRASHALSAKGTENALAALVVASHPAALDSSLY